MVDDFIEHYQNVVSDGSDAIPSWMMRVFDGLFMLAVGVFCLPIYVLGLIVRTGNWSNDHE